MSTLPDGQELCRRIHLVRGHRVLLQDDLARLYGATLKRVLDHAQRFPGDLCFPLEYPEIVYTSDSPEPSSQPVYGFTEHGALALAYVLDTPTAVTMSQQVLHAFLQSRKDDSPRRSFVNSFL